MAIKVTLHESSGPRSGRDCGRASRSFPAHASWPGSAHRTPHSLALKRSSAEIDAHHTRAELIGRLVVAVTNFPPRQIATFRSEVLVLGVPGGAAGDVILLPPDADVKPGTRVFSTRLSAHPAARGASRLGVALRADELGLPAPGPRPASLNACQPTPRIARAPKVAPI